jgi:hypothetical protein
VAQKGGLRVFLRHAAAVVGDPDALPARLFDVDEYLSCARVEGILYQFLDHGRGPLHHFTGGYLVYEMVGEYFDKGSHKYQ